MIAGWGNVIIDNQPKFFDLNEVDNQVLAIGNCRSYGDVCISSNHYYYDAKSKNRFLELDVTGCHITVEAGMTLSRLLNFIEDKGFVLMVTPGTSFATIGGCIANDVHGKNHETVGSFAECVIEFSLRLPSGDIIKCSRHTHSDIFWATIGGLGLTGIILKAQLRLKKVDNTSLAVTRTRHYNLQQLMQSMDKFKNAPYSVAWIDTSQTKDSLGRGILEIAHHAHEGVITDYKPSEKKIPFKCPSWFLNPAIVKLFNHYYFMRSSANKQSFEAYRQFQYPLDHLHHWNKLYGSDGFYQFQCVIPFDDAEKIIRNILSLSISSGLISPLAVLKRLGKPSEGLLSFPQAGYTLALDIPAKQGAVGLLRTFEQMITEVKGRIYPAKDALMTQKSFDMMYPNKEKFLTILKDINARSVSKAAIRYGLNYE
jgi:decaprenylphospho-beta-D-ribofuranose 2-oxidase